MTTDRPRPLQFSLRSVFGLMALVGLLSWLVSGGSQDAPLFLPCYLFLGLAQIVLARIVWKQRLRLPWSRDLDRQACEAAVIAGGLTLVPWALLVVSLALVRLDAVRLLPQTLVVVLLVFGLIFAAVMHVMGFVVNLVNFVLSLGALRDGLLLALILLNAANTAVPILFLWWATAR